MDIKRQSGLLEVDGIKYTATVHVRHSPNCSAKDKGSDWTKCNCRKSMLVYNGATKVQDRMSARTRSWTSAATQAEAWLDQFDPTKIEQKKQDAAKVSVAKAIQMFHADKQAQNLSNGTINTSRCLMGDVDSEGNVLREGKLLPFLAALNPPVHYVSDITSAHLLEWRNTWEQGDMTAYISWGTVKSFFKFCTTHGWTAKNPAADIKRPKPKKGNRTAIFTDKQYAQILKACTDDKLLAFVMLLRWSGMALIDATVFDINTLGKDNVIRYKRVKTSKLAVPQMPDDVAKMLRHLASDSDQPFLHSGMKLESSEAVWRRELQSLFDKVGIKTVKTELGERNPHPHMFRDTCAVWYLRHGMSLHSVAKILGDTIKTVEDHYLPFVKELEDAVIDETKAIQEKFIAA